MERQAGLVAGARIFSTGRVEEPCREVSNLEDMHMGGDGCLWIMPSLGEKEKEHSTEICPKKTPDIHCVVPCPIQLFMIA